MQIVDLETAKAVQQESQHQKNQSNIDQINQLESQLKELQNQQIKQNRISWRKVSKYQLYLKDSEKKIIDVFEMLNKLLGKPEKLKTFSKDQLVQKLRKDL